MATISTEIHRGDSAHIHDHSISPDNFKIINAIVKTDTIPIPLFFVFLSIKSLHELHKSRFVVTKLAGGKGFSKIR